MLSVVSVMKEEIVKQRFKESKSVLVIGPLLINKVSIVSKLCTLHGNNQFDAVLITVSMKTKAKGFCHPSM